MCMQISQFCSGSTKPLLFVGGLLSLILAVAIGYMGCTSNALYADIDPQVAQSRSLGYYLQLAAAGYLTLITLFSCYAAHTDQKHSIRALAIVSALNLILAVAVITMMQPHQELSKPFIETLKRAASKYDRTKKEPPAPPQAVTTLPLVAEALDKGSGTVMNVSASPKSRRYADETSDQKVEARDPTQEEATRIWDRLQARGCCGINNGTEEWKPTIPKSCCAQPIENGSYKICEQVDVNHQQGCAALIDSTGLNLLIVIALIALVNFYLATISGISAYRTFHYNEANQSAYT